MNHIFGDFKEGQIIAVNKPYNMNSTSVVSKVKWLIKNKLGNIKVGHAGTLDPLATGVLVLCTGKATKQVESIQAMEKEYRGTIRLGATTATYDSQFEPDALFPWEHITGEMVNLAVQGFMGEQQQVPPRFSAIKVGGKRSYERSRKGEEFELKPRSILIKEFEITRMELPELDFRIVCSKGTYIRSIAFDMGRKLGSGAYLAALCRTRVGSYSLEKAFELKNLIDLLQDIEKPNEAVQEPE